MTSHGPQTPCDAPETPTQWKYGCVRTDYGWTDLLTDGVTARDAYAAKKVFTMKLYSNLPELSINILIKSPMLQTFLIMRRNRFLEFSSLTIICSRSYCKSLMFVTGSSHQLLHCLCDFCHKLLHFHTVVG